MEGVERLIVINEGIFHTPRIMHAGVFRTDGRIIQTSGNRMCGDDLSVFILQNVRIGAVEYARGSSGKSCRVISQLRAPSAGLDADHPDCGVRYKRMEEADGIAASAHTGDQHIR